MGFWLQNHRRHFRDVEAGLLNSPGKKLGSGMDFAFQSHSRHIDMAVMQPFLSGNGNALPTLNALTDYPGFLDAQIRLKQNDQLAALEKGRKSDRFSKMEKNRQKSMTEHVNQLSRQLQNEVRSLLADYNRRHAGVTR